MADEVARLVAVMEANLKGFQKGMDQAQKIADRRFGQIERRMNQTEKGFANFGRNIGRAFTGIVSIAGITRFVSAVGDMAGRLQDTSDALGVSTDFLQTWQALALQAGVRQEQSNKALEQFAQRLGEAQIKGGQFKKFLDGIGVGTQGNVQEVIMRIADAVRDTASAEQRAAIVAESFGAKQVKLTSLVQQGSDAIQRQGAELARTGGIMSREAIAKIDELGDKWEELKRRFTVIGGDVLGGFADEFSRFADDLTDPQFQEGLRNLGVLLADLVILTGRLASGAGNIAGLFLPSGDEITQLRALIDDWKSLNLAPGSVGAGQLEEAEARLRALLRKRAERAGLGQDFSIPVGAPKTGIDRTGALESGDEPKSLTEAIDMTDALHKLEQQIMDTFKAEREWRSEQFEMEKERRDQAYDHGQEIIELQREEAQKIQDIWDEYDQRQAEMAQDAHDLLKEDIGDALMFLGEAALEGGDMFTRALRSMIIQATMLAIKMNLLKPLIEWALGGAPGSGFLGGLLEGRASGGRVNPNQPYIVGERRPELFVPDTAGTIIPKLPNIPSPQSAAMGGMTITLQQNMTLAANGDAQLAQLAQRAAMDGAQMAVKTIQRSFPAMMIKAQRDSL